MTGSQITTELSRIVDQLVMDSNPTILDDDLPDLMANVDKRNEAVDTLIKMIEYYRDIL